MQKITHIVGIDEAGRGPLAGPVAVGLVMVPHDFDFNLIPKVNDSKKISPKIREEIFVRASKLSQEGVLSYTVVLTAASVIDRKGISVVIRESIEKGLVTLEVDRDTSFIKLDGLLSAPAAYSHQETIIKGDAKEKVIGLASIMAKVTRDRYMERIAKKYPLYEFEIHKGYGTKKHLSRIEEYGLSKIHRRTFCRRFLPVMTER